MHAVKKNTTQKIDYYSSNIEEKLSERKKLETKLKNGLKNKEFVLHYQPLISTSSQDSVGLEALIRWNHPEKGMISPGVFIPIAEESGIIKEMGDWVIKKACSDIKKLNDRLNTDMFISVNVSPQQFRSDNFVSRVQKILFKTGLNPENLELEITERTTMNNIEYTINSLEELSKLGVKIAIDDFGTGYSSLSYLKEFAIDILKIDKSFIDNFIDNNDNRAIVATIITIGHNLDLKVIAEGVETEKQAEKLKEFNCDIIQGYLYSKPIPIEEIHKII